MARTSREMNAREAKREQGPAKLTPADKKELRRALALVCLPCTFVIWLGCLVTGIVLSEEIPKSEVSLPLLWYDDILKVSGAVLPFSVFLLRVVGESFTRERGEDKKGSRPAGGLPAVQVYIGITCVRWAIYYLHLATEEMFGHWLSDHIVLGTSMSSIVQAELLLTAAALWEGAYKPKEVKMANQVVKVIFLELGVLSSTVLSMLTSADMFYTARYFHPRFESTMAFIVGLAFFQIPSMFWVFKRMTA